MSVFGTKGSELFGELQSGAYKLLFPMCENLQGEMPRYYESTYKPNLKSRSIGVAVYFSALGMLNQYFLFLVW